MSGAPQTAFAVPGIVPDWAAPSRVRAFVSLREGGVSAGAYGDAQGRAHGLNLGDHVGDDPQHVATNRARLQSSLPGPICWMRQVHGIDVWDADAGAVGDAQSTARPLPAFDGPTADAAVTSRPGAVLAIMTADCLPILLTDTEGRAVACAHAGWRGLASGVVGATVQSLQDRLGASAHLLAWLGPAIGPRAFEVGPDVYSAFCDADPGAHTAFVQRRDAAGKWWADLYALARRELARCGVRSVSGGDLCTVSDARRFYSHRRDRVTGRMVSLVWIDP